MRVHNHTSEIKSQKTRFYNLSLTLSWHFGLISYESIYNLKTAYHVDSRIYTRINIIYWLSILPATELT